MKWEKHGIENWVKDGLPELSLCAMCFIVAGSFLLSEYWLQNIGQRLIIAVITGGECVGLFVLLLRKKEHIPNGYFLPRLGHVQTQNLYKSLFMFFLLQTGSMVVIGFDQVPRWIVIALTGSAWIELLLSFRFITGLNRFRWSAFSVLLTGVGLLAASLIFTKVKIPAALILSIILWVFFLVLGIRDRNSKVITLFNKVGLFGPVIYVNREMGMVPIEKVIYQNPLMQRQTNVIILYCLMDCVEADSRYLSLISLSDESAIRANLSELTNAGYVIEMNAENGRSNQEIYRITPNGVSAFLEYKNENDCYFAYLARNRDG